MMVEQVGGQKMQSCRGERDTMICMDGVDTSNKVKYTVKRISALDSRNWMKPDAYVFLISYCWRLRLFRL